MSSIWLSTLYWISSMEYVVFSSGMFLVEGLRYVGLVLFEKGVDLFSPLVESCFQLLVILPAVADLPF